MNTQILSAEEIATRLQELAYSWTAMGNDYLINVVECVDYVTGAALVQAIAAAAQERAATPQITLENGGKVTVELATESVAGITADDFAFAAVIDQLVA